jgi:Sulfotransferase family
LLPLLYSLREHGVHAEYDHSVMARGARGFAEAYLPLGVESYENAIHDFALTLYGAAAPGKTYFLDKTPRYHLIADELLRIFPKGRFVFLWRHPLAVAASLIETFAHGNWNLDRYSADLFRGLPQLVSAFRQNRDRVAAVRYEDLVADPVAEVARLLGYLDLRADDSIVTRFRDLEMRNPEFWDPTGTAQYDHVSAASVERWQQIMTNPLRKAWCRWYLRWLGEERLGVMGYRLDELLAEVDAIRTSALRLPSDLVSNTAGYARRRLRTRILGTSFPLWHEPRYSMTTASDPSDSEQRTL